MATNKNDRMSETEFEEFREKLADFSVRKVETARLILVEGLTQKEAGERQGLSKQVVNALVKRIREIRAKAPTGWVQINEYVPPKMKIEILKRLEKLRE